MKLTKEIKIKNVAIMTSGGDSPGMNMVVATLLKLLFKAKIHAMIVNSGIRGLLNNDIKPFDYEKFLEFADNIFLSGTVIKSSRVLEFHEEKNIELAAHNLALNEIDLLIVIGGDGSLQATNALRKKGINVMFIPGSIDNDLSYTDYSIGYDSALNLILKDVYAIRNTVKSFDSFCLIEVMGRDHSDLSVNTALATFADGIITRQRPWSIDDFCNRINWLKNHNKHWGIFIVTEKFYGTDNFPSYTEIVKKVEEKTNVHMKFDSIGYAQRGAVPTSSELVFAFKIAKYCVDCILKHEINKLLGWKNGSLISLDFDELPNTRKSNNEEVIDLLNSLVELDYSKLIK